MPKCPFPIRISFFSYFVNESRILSSDPFKLSIHLRFSSSVSVSPKTSMEAENPLEAPISEQMFKSAPKMGSYKLGDSTLSSMIENYANSGDFASVEKLLSRIRLENRVIVEHSFIVVFRAYGKAHLPEKAVDLFHRMVDALCKLGFVDRAIEVFRAMPEKKCLPDGYTYCTLMDGLCKEERIDEAVLLLDEMQSEGCSPSPVTYNVLIDGLCKKGDLTRVTKLVDNMFLKGCVPNEVTYNTLIHGLCLKGKLDKAVSLLERMVSSKCIPNDVTYGTLINGLVKQRRAMDGARLLISMEERGYCLKKEAILQLFQVNSLGVFTRNLNLFFRVVIKG